MKNFLRLSFVLGSFLMLQGKPAAAQSSELQQLKQMIAVLKVEIASAKLGTFAVGSVQQSFLTEEAFQKQMGTGWVLCDGRSVAGSQWDRLGYGKNIPDCSGRFLRTAGGTAAPLRNAQEQGTAVNNLSAATSLIQPIAVSGETKGADWTGDLSSTVSENAPTDPQSTNYGGVDGWFNAYVGKDVPYWNRMWNHTHRFSATIPISSVSMATTVTSRDSETRPVNISVNSFIRIN